MELAPNQSLILVVEPVQAHRHVDFQVTYHYWDREGNAASDTFSIRDQFRMCDEVNARMLGAGPDDICNFNLHRTKT